jgi:hypothetical protein
LLRIRRLSDLDRDRASFEPNKVAPRSLARGTVQGVAGRHVEGNDSPR